MSTVVAVDEKVPDEVKEKVSAEAEMAVGGTTPPALVPESEVLKWFTVVEVPELGFRAFCRLPNEYQHADLREKALAAKSRRARQYKNVDTDAHEVLEADLEEIASLVESEAKETFVAELLLRDFLDDRRKAVGLVLEKEEFEHVLKDQERYRELDDMPEDERPNDEYLEVLDHLSKFGDAIQLEVDDVREPRREALMAMEVDQLKDKVRELRIKNQAHKVFADNYGFNQTYLCTLKLPDGFDAEHITPDTMPTERVFASEDALHHADPYIVSKLQETFEDLENGLESRAAGNS